MEAMKVHKGGPAGPPHRDGISSKRKKSTPGKLCWFFLGSYVAIFEVFMYLLVTANPTSLVRHKHIWRMEMMCSLPQTRLVKQKRRSSWCFSYSRWASFQFRCFKGGSILLLWHSTESVNSSFQWSFQPKWEHNVQMFILITPIGRYLFLENSKAFYYPLFPFLKGFHRFR